MVLGHRPRVLGHPAMVLGHPAMAQRHPAMAQGTQSWSWDTQHQESKVSPPWPVAHQAAGVCLDKCWVPPQALRGRRHSPRGGDGHRWVEAERGRSHHGQCNNQR